jgi:RNA polymerase sigma factor (sigma-70 family)
MSRQHQNPRERQAATSTAVTEAYLQHESSLRRFIWRLMRNSHDVEDVAQDTFLRAYVAEKGRPIEQPKSFLFRIARHVALTRLQRKDRRIIDYIEDVDHSEVVCPDGSPEEQLSAQEVLHVHCEAIMGLRPQCRRAYLLRKIHSLSHREIAEQMGLTVSTVEKHLMKAIAHCERYVRERVQTRTGVPGISVLESEGVE